MKLSPVIFSAAFIFSIALGMPVLQATPGDIAFLPNEKKPVVVDANERNPFGKRISKAEPKISISNVSEEAIIRNAVARIRVQGLTRSYGEVKVLLGSQIVGAGMILPDVIPNQTEKLRVLSVTAERVELGFVEGDGTVKARKLTLPIHLEPTVRYQIGSKAPAPAPSQGASDLDGVMKDNGPDLPQ